MSEQLKNGERLVLAYPEVNIPETDWAYSNIPVEGTILVTRDGLRKLLQLADKCFSLATAMILLNSKNPAVAKEMYPQVFEKKFTSDIMNATSKVFCEGTLTISGLFVGEDGKPVINPCVEGDK